MSEEKQIPLLVIELEKESSLPKVIYKGKEIKYQQHIYSDCKGETEHGRTQAMLNMEVTDELAVSDKVERKANGQR